jgi:conjugal transfer pilus assembly protein TraB
VENGTQPASQQQSKGDGEQPSKATGQGEKPSKKEQATVSAGSFVKAVLLNGVDAPTGSKGKGSPYPVLLRIIDLAQLPNRFRADIKECFAVGEAMGELSSERVMTRVTTLSCVSKSGNIIESQVTGYVVGEDGKIGQSATIVTRQGAILARSLISGFLQGVSQAFSASATTVNVSPYGTVSTINPSEVAKAGVGQGISNAAAGLAKFYDDFSREMFPVAEVNAGRECEIVFINRFNLTEVK